jgi:hypothetical protein
MTRIDDRWFLPVEGLVSGFLTCLVPALPFGLGRAVFLYVGLVFGAVIAGHVRLFRGERSAFRLLGFTATCTVAYTLSVLATMWSPLRPQFLNFSGTSSGAVDSSPFFTGGFLGAAIVSVGIYLFFAPSKSWPKVLLKALCISVACGFLGVLGWAVGEQLSSAGFLPRFGSNLSYYALYIIWQAGAAPLFGLLLSPQQTLAAAPVGVQPASVTPRTKTGRVLSSAPATIFLVLIVATLAWFIVRQVRGERAGRHMLAARHAAQQQLAAERPSPSQNLPATIVEPRVDQVLLLKPITGHPCGRNFKWKIPKSDFVGYSAGYKRSEAASDGEVSFADVNVSLYSNSEWAIYATKEANSEAADPQQASTVTKFGNKVIMNTSQRYPNGDGDLSFYWASGSRFIRLTFRGPEDDEFLKEYLTLYPSAL